MTPYREKPPRIAEWLLRNMSDPEAWQSLIGDIEEEYLDIRAEKSTIAAVGWYWFQVVISTPSFVKFYIYWSITMLKNYLIVAFRNLRKHKLHSIINICGLAVGMASMLLIYLYVREELSYDRYHSRSQRIYRVAKSSEDAPIPHFVGTPAPLAPTFKEKFPEIEDYVRFDLFLFKPKTLISYKENSFYEDRFVLADPSIFDVFDFTLIHGAPETVLADPNSIVITKSMSDKYFGSENPVGNLINYDGKFDLKVTGVMEDVPENSHLKFDFVGSFENINDFYDWDTDLLNNWGTSNFYTYFLLKENVNPAHFEEKSMHFLREISGEDNIRIYVQPLVDIHLDSRIPSVSETGGDINKMYLYSVTAVLIMLIACINFINLNTAHSETRSKEVGIRKVIGAHRKQLISQFLGESFLLAVIALPFALLLVIAAIPQFNHITGAQLDLDFSKHYYLIGVLFIITFVVGLLSGSYPAFFISSFQPVKMLRGKLSIGNRGRILRNLLVVFQFTVSIILITGSLFINSQMQFIRNRDLGYDRENIVNIPMYSSETKSKYEIFRNEIIENHSIVDASATSFTPSVERWREGMYFEGRQENDKHMFFRMAGDFNIIELFDMQLIKGRAFDRNLQTDLEKSYILNESAVSSIGWSINEAVGKEFGFSEGRVIGVVKDFNFRSLRKDMQPLAINISPGGYNFISIKIKPENIQNTVEFLEQSWKRINPGFPFEYYFYDEEFEKLYKSDLNMGALFGYFTFLAIFIACLGLFGLSLFMVQQRTKEISIRKVVGARVRHIVVLLIRDLVKWIIVANIIAVPIAYLGVMKWMEGFAYRTNIEISLFFFASLLTLLTAMLTVSVQVGRAAYAKPVDSLRYE